MGVLEFFYYQEISAMLLTQSKNFLPLFLTLFLHKKWEHKKIISGKKKKEKMKKKVLLAQLAAYTETEIRSRKEGKQANA